MAVSFEPLLDPAQKAKSVAQILVSSPSVLKSVSAAKAGKLKEALGVDTLRDLATNGSVRTAQALLAAAGSPPYDPGPGVDWAGFFATAPLDHYVTHPSHRFRIEFGPVYYRGRLDGTARVLLVGQDPSTDEILAGRIFVGQSGQRVQGLLRKLGIARSYVLVNTFLFPVYGQFDAPLGAISQEAPVLGFRNQLLDRIAAENRIEAVLTIGAAAKDAVQRWPKPAGLTVFDLTHPSAPEAQVTASWNGALAAMAAAIRPDDGVAPNPAPYGPAFQPGDSADIPRFDLPFGVPSWHGAQGATTSARDGATKIVWTAPT